MTPSFSHADWLRAGLVVLSDRRPAPGAPRTRLESAIEWALREHDGVWLVRHAGAEPGSGAAGGGGDDRERWSVLEGAPAPPRSSMEEWTGYVRANAAYAERILESVGSRGTVWINGHRWLLVAPALRELGHRGPIGLLLDTPFPARARLAALPWGAEVVAALCQLDLIGFRAQECADRFEACRERTGGRRPWIAVLPDGLGPAARTDPPAWATSFLQLLASAARRHRRPAFIG